MVFVDDSRQSKPRRPGFSGELVAVGGIMLEAEAGAAAEEELSELCKRTGLPDGDELKWSPPSTAWMPKGLVGDDRQAFFEEVACILASHHAMAIAVTEANGRGTATEAADAEHDVVELLFALAVPPARSGWRTRFPWPG